MAQSRKEKEKKYCIFMVAYFCHHLSDNYVDLLDLCVILSDLYVELSDLHVDLSIIILLENKSLKMFPSPVNAIQVTTNLNYLTHRHNI